jgi:hypothetical protein
VGAQQQQQQQLQQMQQGRMQPALQELALEWQQHLQDLNQQ